MYLILAPEAQCECDMNPACTSPNPAAEYECDIDFPAPSDIEGVYKQLNELVYAHVQDNHLKRDYAKNKHEEESRYDSPSTTYKLQKIRDSHSSVSEFETVNATQVGPTIQLPATKDTLIIDSKDIQTVEDKPKKYKEPRSGRQKKQPSAGPYKGRLTSS